MEYLELKEIFDDFLIVGDSYTDSNNFLFVDPSGGIIPNLNLYFPGRFTNGLVDDTGELIPNENGETEGVWLDYFSQELELNLSSFFRDIELQEGDLRDLDGVNFALGADTTTGNLVLGPDFGLNNQIRQLNNLVSNFEQDIIFHWIGGNDYLARVFNPEEESIDSPEEIELIANQVVSNIRDSLITLLEEGAEVIVVLNQSNIGLTPLAVETGEEEVLEDLTIAHNQELETTLESLRITYPESKIIGIDIFSLYNEEIVPEFEFEPVTTSNLYSTPDYDIRLDDRLFSPVPNAEFLSNYQTFSAEAENAAFWDSVHPTTAVHKIYSDHILDVLMSEIFIIGTDEDDELIGQNGKEKISGLQGKDTITGGTGNDTIEGGKGRDFIFGDTGNDLIYGDNGNDLLNGGHGDDTIMGNENNDTIIGKQGQDILSGGDGNDTLTGKKDNDILIGGNGNDFLSGGNDDDLLSGGDGDDLISGDRGNDFIDGGNGIDTAIYDRPVTDFQFLGSPESLIVKQSGEQQEILVSIEFLQFTDGTYTTREVLTF